MPDDYPKNPPKATFKTRIYHPNVEESTGAVCLDTLKKDWQSKLTLRDVLVTIGCLLIHPNPDSALNSAAGSLLQEDYEAFAKQARLMTSIHAPIPPRLKSAVQNAKLRGEDGCVILEEGTAQRPTNSKALSGTCSLVMKKNKSSSRPQAIFNQRAQSQELDTTSGEVHDEAKENDPSQSPSPVSVVPSSPRKNVLGKRPLSELPTPTDPDSEDLLEEMNGQNMTASERNILAGQRIPSLDEASPRVRKSPKLEKSVQELPQDTEIEQQDVPIYEDPASSSLGFRSKVDEKENIGTSSESKEIEATKSTASVARPTLRKVSNIGSARGRGQTRAGIRRL